MKQLLLMAVAMFPALGAWLPAMQPTVDEDQILSDVCSVAAYAMFRDQAAVVPSLAPDAEIAPAAEPPLPLDLPGSSPKSTKQHPTAIEAQPDTAPQPPQAPPPLPDPKPAEVAKIYSRTVWVSTSRRRGYYAKQYFTADGTPVNASGERAACFGCSQ